MNLEGVRNCYKIADWFSNSLQQVQSDSPFRHGRACPACPGLAEWCGHLLERLHRQCEATADPELIRLYHDLKAFPVPARSAPLSSDSVAIPFRMRLGGDILSFFSTTMIFGTPVDITLSELALETFFPADDLTAKRMRAIAADLK